jgi:hypothetical protein
MKKTEKIEIKKLYLETSERFGGYTHLVAVTKNNDEYTLHGDHCWGVPASSWYKINN